MRSATFGIKPHLAQASSPELSLELFRRMCWIRHFELNVVRATEEGWLTYPVYLSMGQEAVPAALSIALPQFMIFAQHRCHGIYLAFGGDPGRLRDELLGLSTGTSGGRAGSNCIQCHDGGIRMFGHHGLIGENVPLSVGAALGSGKPAVCLFGDGAAEEDYVFASMGFAVTHHLPVLFVCEDNDLSILTPVAKRRSWSLTQVARSLGMAALDLTDDPWTLVDETRKLIRDLPAFLNCYTCRGRWHVGVGQDGPPEWDRFQRVKEQLEASGLGANAFQIETDVREAVEHLWDRKRLPIRSVK